MKKVLFMALAVAGLCLTSCKNKAAEGTEVKKDTTAVAAAVEVDPASDPAVELAQAVEAKDQSKLEALLTTVKEKASDPKFKEYIEKAQNFLKEKAADIKAFIGDNAIVSGLIDNVSSIDITKLVGADAAATAVEGAAEGAKETVEGAKSAVEGAVEGAKETGEKVVEDAKAAANKAVETAKEAPAAAADAAKQAGKDAIQKGADALKNAIK